MNFPHAESATAEISAQVAAAAEKLTPDRRDELSQKREKLDAAIAEGLGRVEAINEKLARVPGSAATAQEAADALLSGVDLMERVGDPETLRRERATYEAALAELGRQLEANSAISVRQAERDVRSIGRAAAPLLAELQSDLADVADRLAGLWAASSALDRAALVPGAARLAEHLKPALVALRRVDALKGEFADVPGFVAEALEPAEARLRELGRGLPTSVRVPS